MRLIISPPSPRRRGAIGLWIFAAVLWLIRVTPAHAQFGGSCGCPVIVNDPQIYGRQASNSSTLIFLAWCRPPSTPQAELGR